MRGAIFCCLDSILFEKLECDGGGTIDAYWGINVTTPSGSLNSSRSSSNDLDVKGGHTESIITNFISADIYKNGSGSINISGSVFDEDTISDDLVAKWDLKYNTKNIKAQQFSVKGVVHEGGCEVYLKFTIKKKSDIF